MAEKVGADIINMDWIQLIPIYYSKTSSIYIGNIENVIMVNQDGNRFVKEDGRRDEVSAAELEQDKKGMFMLYTLLPGPIPLSIIPWGGSGSTIKLRLWIKTAIPSPDSLRPERLPEVCMVQTVSVEMPLQTSLYTDGLQGRTLFWSRFVK